MAEGARYHADALADYMALRLRVEPDIRCADFSKRTFFCTVVDGRYKFVGWFSPEEYGDPSTLEGLYATSDVTLHDLMEDPAEIENLGNPEHPRHRPALVEHMLQKLHALVRDEIGSDSRSGWGAAISRKSERLRYH